MNDDRLQVAELTHELRTAILNPPKCWWETGNIERWADQSPTPEYVMNNFDELVERSGLDLVDKEPVEDFAAAMYRAAADLMQDEQEAAEAARGEIALTVWAQHTHCAGLPASAGAAGADYKRFVGTPEELRQLAATVDGDGGYGSRVARALRVAAAYGRED